eukprot:526640-Pelagomonas_calceolata.AAC.2
MPFHAHTHNHADKPTYAHNTQGGDFRLAQEVCMSAFHHYRELTLISCDMLLECDVIAALNVRAHQHSAVAAKRTLLKQQQQQLQGEGLPVSPGTQNDALEVSCPLQRMQVWI